MWSRHGTAFILSYFFHKMAACCIFDEDEVCIPTSSGGFKYGLVVEISDCMSSDDEEGADENRLQRDQIKVAWHPSGTETVVAEDKVLSCFFL